MLRAFPIPRLLVMNNSCVDCGKKQLTGRTMSLLPGPPKNPMYDNEILFNEINIRVVARYISGTIGGGTSMPAPSIFFPPSIAESAVSGHEIREAGCSWFH